MAVIHFAHSNGFAAGTYRYFLQQLEPHTVQYIAKFGHSQRHSPIHSWQPLADQLIESIEEQQKPVVGLGHSLGAVVSLYACYKRPDLFTCLIMMDPPFFRLPTRSILLIFRILGISGRVVPPAKKARRRKTTWESRTAAAEILQSKPLFANFHPKAFNDYIRYGLADKPDGGVELDFSAEEEYRIFKHTPFWLGSGRLHVPSYYLYSRKFELGSPQTIETMQRKFAHTEFIPVNAGHMFPMEQPDETAALIKSLL